MGHFRREWVAPEVSEANWHRRGVVFRDSDGVMLYAMISRVRRGDELVWWICRFSEGDRGLRRHSLQEEASLDAVLEALATEVRSSRRVHGPVTEDEWPQNREPPQLVPPGSRGWSTRSRRRHLHS